VTIRKNRAGAALTFAFVLSLGWYAGVDLLSRGAEQAFVAMEASLASLSVFMWLTRPIYERSALRVPRALWTAGVPCFMLLWGWYAGIDYLVRGVPQAILLLCAVVLARATWLCPIWEPFEIPSSFQESGRREIARTER
jgi:hypothetical protein